MSRCGLGVVHEQAATALSFQALLDVDDLVLAGCLEALGAVSGFAHADGVFIVVAGQLRLLPSHLSLADKGFIKTRPKSWSELFVDSVKSRKGN